MRALTLTAPGSTDHLLEQELPAPGPPGPGEVLVAVRAAALNRLDLWVAAGLPLATLRFPHVMGSDAAGVVAACGDGVTGFRPGDRVLVNPGLACGGCGWCLAGEQPLCPGFQLLGEHRSGTMAELLLVPARNLAPVPSGFSWAEAAALPLVTVTAWRMLMTRARLQAGETVLIWGIGGGVAQAALAVAREAGARVFVTSGSAAKLERARALGADAALDHASGDVARAVRELTGRRGVDVVVDSVGEKTWEPSLRCLARGGRLVTCGGTSGPMVTTDVRKLFWYQWSLLGSTMGSDADFRAMLRVAERGRLRPVVDSVTPLAHARESYRRLAAGEQFGKLVIEVSRD